MHLEEFAEGRSLLHTLDPRVKFISALPVMALAALSRQMFYPMAILCLAGSLAVMARLDMKKLILRLVAVNTFVLTLWAFLPFSTPGETAMLLGPLRATREGLDLALLITLKTNAIVLMSIAVFGTSEAMSLAHALLHLRVPVKLVYLFFFFYRYLSVVHEEYDRLRCAMRLRCFKLRASLHSYKSLGWLMGMLLVRSHDRAGRVYRAMLCRGFHGHFPVMHHFHLHKSDILAGAGILLYGTASWIWGAMR